MSSSHEWVNPNIDIICRKQPGGGWQVYEPRYNFAGYGATRYEALQGFDKVLDQAREFLVLNRASLNPKLQDKLAYLELALDLKD